MHESSGGHGVVLWFTGLSGSGKSTIAAAVQQRLSEMSVANELLDGDVLRSLLPAGFSPAERDLHVRRAGFLASRLAHHGITVLCALISPYAESRDWVRQRCTRFVEIHVATPLAECERRDVKGLYAAARRGEIVDFTGISAPYHEPRSPDLVLNTVEISLPDAVDRVLTAWTMWTFSEPQTRIGTARSSEAP